MKWWHIIILGFGFNCVFGSDHQNVEGHPGVPWKIIIPATAFLKIDSLSGSENYYSIESDSIGNEYIHAHYLPEIGEPTKLGYKIPEEYTDALQIQWRWQIWVPPQNANEQIRGKNDSGAAVYLLFKRGFQTLIIKYVLSTTLREGTVIRKDPFYPFQRMYVVVVSSWNNKCKGAWQDVSISIQDDFKRLYALKTCPPVLGIGLMSDGDGTQSEVIADYGAVTLSGVKE